MSGKEERAPEKVSIEPYGPDRFLETFELDNWISDFDEPKIVAKVKEFLLQLPKHPKLIAGVFDSPPTPLWNSVALFFNLSSNRPTSYSNTTVQDAREWLDEGDDPASPTISEFMAGYWANLSFNHIYFGLNTPRDDEGTPLIPNVDAPDGNPTKWVKIIRAILNIYAERIWNAAGSLMKGGKRWIPSVVLVQKYDTVEEARSGFLITVNGIEYDVDYLIHMKYRLNWATNPNVPPNSCRAFWGRLCHEYGHNFLGFGDLYGPSGCTGYWDLMGDNTAPGKMSEVCSHLKERKGWISYKEVITGPSYAERELQLRPYTSTGEAYKVVPDPQHTPDEFFLLEYRKSIDNEPWRPDGGLSEEGLLIIHINKKLGIPGVWLLRNAPFFDPEFADFSDNGGTLWTGKDWLDGILFPQSGRTAFTPDTAPSSDLYGERKSGLHITNIRIENDVLKFKLKIDNKVEIGWTLGSADRCHSGRFRPEAKFTGQEIYIRNNNNVALLIHREAHWSVLNKQHDWVGSWNLGSRDYEVVADLDGLDEIYIRSPNYAGVLKWKKGKFRSLTVQHDWIDEWNLGGDNREIAADVDGDGCDEIYIRSPNWAGIIKFEGNRLHLKSIQHDWIDQWNLGSVDRELKGRFTQPDFDEILIRSPQYLGLLYWSDSQQRLTLRSIQHDWIDEWNLGKSDTQYVGDFDGDGLDEIYIRSPNWAGVLKWQNDRFKLQWIRQHDILSMSPMPGASDDCGKQNIDSVDLSASDRSYVGRFHPERDGILHRTNSSVSIFTWENGEMRVRHHMISPFCNRWHLDSNDRFCLGDYHPARRDVGNPALDFIADNLTDVFIYNPLRSGMFGVNNVQWDPTRNRRRHEIGLTWKRVGTLLYNKSPDCFIASCIYGNSSPEVTVLRQFRDWHLHTNRLGQFLIDIYYRISPKLFPILQRARRLRTLTKQIIDFIIRIIRRH